MCLTGFRFELFYLTCSLQWSRGSTAFYAELRLLNGLLGCDLGDYLLQLLVGLLPSPRTEITRCAVLFSLDVEAKRLAAFVFGADRCAVVALGSRFVA